MAVAFGFPGERGIRVCGWNRVVKEQCSSGEPGRVGVINPTQGVCNTVPRRANKNVGSWRLIQRKPLLDKGFGVEKILSARLEPACRASLEHATRPALALTGRFHAKQ